MKRQNIQPEALSKRVVGGHVLYSHVVVVEGKKTVFVSGQLARNRNGDAVGRGDMRAQIRQVGENVKAALAAAGATLGDIVKTNTSVPDTEAFNTPFMVMYAVHDAMVKPMPAGITTPSLAESWTEAKDHLSYTFMLRKGARFHNGEPVTADDVKFSWDRYKGASAKLLKDKVKEVQILDPGQVRFVLREPWPDFITFYGTTASGADERVRLAASDAIDRAAINQAEMLGFGRLTGNFVPRIFQFAVAMEPHAYDPAKAKKLLAEAGYPNGFDAGDFYPFPPYDSMGEAILGSFQAVGIKSRLRTMERAAYFTAWRDKKLHGVIHVITAAFGNAATRLQPYGTKNGV